MKRRAHGLKDRSALRAKRVRRFGIETLFPRKNSNATEWKGKWAGLPAQRGGVNLVCAGGGTAAGGRIGADGEGDWTACQEFADGLRKGMDQDALVAGDLPSGEAAAGNFRVHRRKRD